MDRIVVKRRVGHDGILHIQVPVGVAEADKEMQVTVEPAPPSKMTPEEWRRLILSTAGKWQGEFERPDQGEYEEREPLA